MMNVQLFNKVGVPQPLDRLLKNPATNAFTKPMFDSIDNRFSDIQNIIQNVKDNVPRMVEQATKTMNLVRHNMATDPVMPENRFVFELYYPEAVDKLLQERGIFNSPIITFTQMNTYIRASQIPGKIIEVEPFRIFGLPRMMPQRLRYEHVFPVTFAMSSDVRLRMMFDLWMNMVVNPDTGSVGYYDEFARPFNLNIYALDRQDNPVFAMGADEVFPIEVSPIALDQNATNSFATFTVTFAYRKLFPFRALTKTALPQDAVRAALPFSSFASQKEYYLR
jgi:hypothetical protein